MRMETNNIETATMDSPDSILLKPQPEAAHNEEILGRKIEGFEQKKTTHMNPCPFVKIYDPNNMRRQDYYDGNPERSAIIVGVKWSF